MSADFGSFLDGGSVIRRVVRLAEEHGTPNGFFAQEVATRFAPPGTVGRILKTKGAADLLESYGLVITPRPRGGYDITKCTTSEVVL